jgi:peptidoglycan/LPS O-acetylase OafA/YrhL
MGRGLAQSDGPIVSGSLLPGRKRWLDVLRGFALVLVMLRHSFPNVFPGAGVVGVNIFFALSGFLVTRSLLDEHERSGRIDCRRFWRKRIARVVPALLIFIAAVVAVTVAWDPLGEMSRLPHTVLAALTFTGDVPLWRRAGSTYHLWTLAVEAQFYLLWPLVVAWAARRGGVRLALTLALLACLTAAAGTLVWLWEDPVLAYALPTPWASGIVVGALAAHANGIPVPGRALRAIAVATLCVLSISPLRTMAWVYVGGAPVVALATSVLMLSAVTARSPLATPWNALASLGGVSYSAFLWNYALVMWLGAIGGPTLALAAIPLTLLVAAFSARAAEHPLLYRRWRTT